jgi:hypothetical protein
MGQESRRNLGHDRRDRHAFRRQRRWSVQPPISERACDMPLLRRCP